MGLALYFAYTRSGIIALGIGTFAIILLLKGRLRIVMLLVALLVTVSFLFYADARDTRYSQGFIDDQSAAGRLVLWQAGANIALDNPVLGIGYWEFEETSLEYASEIDPLYMETQGAGSVLGYLEVHNDFLRIWLSFGTPALLAFLCLFVNIFRNFLNSYRHASSLFLKGLALGGIGALAAYAVSASTHNVMDSVFLLWILGGISIAINKPFLSEQSRIEEEAS
jgi:O-antigen ligase